MSYSNCPTCCGLVWSSEAHRCQPKWEAFVVDWGDEDDPGSCHASCAEGAARRYFESRDDEPGDGFDNEYTVKVRKVGEERWQAFVVTREAVIHYNATPAKDSARG